jgi:hypothetical protein
MTDLPLILADNEGELTKILFGLVFFLIWAVSAAMSVIAKKKEQERRRRAQEQLQRSEGLSPVPAGPAPEPMRHSASRQQLPSRAPQRMPPPLPKQPQPARPQRAPVGRPAPAVRRTPAPTQRRAAVSRPVPAQPLAPLPAESEAHGESASGRMPVAATEISSASAAARRSSTTATAAAIRAWLTPQTLRRQYILTEILQPPVTMRQSHLEH